MIALTLATALQMASCTVIVTPGSVFDMARQYACPMTRAETVALPVG